MVPNNFHSLDVYSFSTVFDNDIECYIKLNYDFLDNFNQNTGGPCLMRISLLSLTNLISLLRVFLAIFGPKIALAKYLPNAIFGLCEFSQEPKVE